MRDLAVRLMVYVTNHVIAHIPVHALRRAWYRRIGLMLGADSAIHLGCYVWFYGPGHLARVGATIGERTIVNRDCCLDARSGLTIGSDVSISPNVTILTTQHRWREPGFRLEGRPVVIEDHVWIGMGATVLPGAVIGRGAVVAAGAVVSGIVPPLAVVAGVPGRVVADRPESALEYHLENLDPAFE